MRGLGTGEEVVHFPGWNLCYIRVHNGTDANLHRVHHPIGVETLRRQSTTQTKDKPD